MGRRFREIAVVRRPPRRIPASTRGEAHRAPRATAGSSTGIPVEHDGADRSTEALRPPSAGIFGDLLRSGRCRVCESWCTGGVDDGLGRKELVAYRVLAPLRDRGGWRLVVTSPGPSRLLLASLVRLELVDHRLHAGQQHLVAALLLEVSRDGPIPWRRRLLRLLALSTAQRLRGGHPMRRGFTGTNRASCRRVTALLHLHRSSPW